MQISETKYSGKEFNRVYCRQTKHFDRSTEMIIIMGFMTKKIFKTST